MIYFCLFFHLPSGYIFTGTFLTLLLHIPRFSLLRKIWNGFSINLSYHFSHAIKRNRKRENKINWMSFAFFFLVKARFGLCFQNLCRGKHQWSFDIEGKLNFLRFRIIEQSKKVSSLIEKRFFRIWKFQFSMTFWITFCIVCVFYKYFFVNFKTFLEA